MSNPISLRQPATISNMSQLEVAKKKAQINASEDRLRLASNLNELKNEGPKVIMKEVVLPAIGVAVAVFAVSKLIQRLSRSDDRNYYYEPHYDDAGYPESYLGDTDGLGHSRRKFFGSASGASPSLNLSEKDHSSGVGETVKSAARLSRYLPVMLHIAKLGVNYMERSGKPVHPLIHDLLSPIGAPTSNTATETTQQYRDPAAGFSPQSAF